MAKPTGAADPTEPTAATAVATLAVLAPAVLAQLEALPNPKIPIGVVRSKC